ncbi:MAG: response regulator transcription factor [Epsilonproteobacteria bacterium]|nr:response regulator transcription factor [Campylobacterota bacterium]
MDEFNDFTILYIEDDEGIRAVNLRILKRMFKDVFEASDGLEGYNIYLEKKPDIVLTDIKMPKMDGIELAKKIREKDEKVKIIISTAFSDEKYLLAAVELGLERYLVKPLTKRNLIPALQKAISNISKEKKLFFDDNFYYNFSSELFYQNDNVLEMTKKELYFLRLLIKNKNIIVTYNMIEQEVWEDEYMSINSLRTTIGFLRKKLPKNIIKNISNMGYKLKIDN